MWIWPNNNQNAYKNKSGEQQEKKISKLESMKLLFQKKYIQSALLLALLGTGGIVWYDIMNKSHEKEKIETIKNLKWYPFEKHTLDFRDNDTTFFTKDLQLKKETIAPGIEIIRDVGLVFYVVQKDDIKTKTETTYTYKKKAKKKIKIPHTITHTEADFEKIRHKLSTIPEFSYLKENEYDRINPNNKTKSFNVPKESVKKGMYIPIPLDHEVREISPMDFANYCYDALHDMKNDSTKYGKEINKLLTYASEQDIITAMLAFARSETAAEYTNFTQPLWYVELHRREPAYKAFSFTYFHILMEKNSDGVTAWPWLKARLKLWLTEGQCYHPKNAAKLFLAYRIEKTNGHLQGIFPLTADNLEKVGKKYNWSADYADKLWPNFTFATKLMNGEITYYDDINLKKMGFTHIWFNSNYQHVYKFVTPKEIKNNHDLKKIVVEEFNKNKATNCPDISEEDVVTQSNKEISGTIVPDTVLIKVPKEK